MDITNDTARAVKEVAGIPQEAMVILTFIFMVGMSGAIIWWVLRVQNTQRKKSEEQSQKWVTEIITGLKSDKIKMAESYREEVITLRGEMRDMRDKIVQLEARQKQDETLIRQNKDDLATLNKDYSDCMQKLRQYREKYDK